PGAARATPLLPYLALLRVGFAEPARSPAPLVSSYLTVSPLPPRHPFGHRRDGGLLSVALVRGVAPPGGYPAPCPAEPGLSSRRVAATGDRPAFSGASDSIADHALRAHGLSAGHRQGPPASTHPARQGPRGPAPPVRPRRAPTPDDPCPRTGRRAWRARWRRADRDRVRAPRIRRGAGAASSGCTARLPRSS